MSSITSSYLEQSEWKPAVTVVVPTRNEAGNIYPLIERVLHALSDRTVEILFVDDSNDTETVPTLERACMHYVTKQYVVHMYHRTGDQSWGGLSGAVVDGMRRAMSDRIVVMDGDLQHPPELLPEMLAAAESNDVVVASRYCAGGDAGGLSDWRRHLVSRGSTLLAKTMFPYRLRKVTDPMTGYFAVDRSKLDLDHLSPNGFKILLEILAVHRGLSVTEIPLHFEERVSGESKGDLKQGLQFLGQLGALKNKNTVANLLRLPKPVQFGLIGGGVFAVGMAVLYTLVDLLHVNPLFANAIQLAITFYLNFVLNLNITWRDRTVTRQASLRFVSSRLATTVINYLLFAWLIAQQLPAWLGGQLSLGIRSILVNIVALAVIMAMNYVVSDKWVFADKPAEATDAKIRRLTLASLRNNTFRGVVLAGLLFSFLKFPGTTFAAAFTVIGLLMFLQSCLEAWRMMYSYREPETVERLKFPVPTDPQEQICLIVPGRYEQAVIAETLSQLARQTHPNVHIVAVMCDDDHETLAEAYRIAAVEPTVEVIEFPLLPGVKPSKPKQLNYVLEQIKDRGYTVIGIVDAEDSVHPELLRHIDTAFQDKEIDIVQGGVQLMNHDSSWYSLHNVLEYYRWFTSAMAFQADNRFMPLGGNTIFLRHSLLQKAGGWPETLTEDCSLGVLVSTRYNTKTAVYYEPGLATQEETPDSLTALFKQRVRWNQGFFHEWRRGIWKELPYRRQRWLACYVLLGPVFLAVSTILVLMAVIASIFLSAPVGLVMLMYVPLVPMTLLLVLNAIFLHDFGKAFNRRVRIRHYVSLFVTYSLYQAVLNAAAFWSVIRELRGNQTWYKTSHSGLHRESTSQPMLPQGAMAMNQEPAV